ncbi:hypothetical protein [Proteiniborus sp. MB09-C3]|uniref:hypothetical protein n=1 Tax=Proteiniborus sp. MB09-C3 TaxID=3050072 RepID=UPI0025543F25|nr:hypothetical protein [Proteiniborus sp. MB09-C3]WIV11444.1 hypothetical protein QO263_15280 [Proteiniborus sp. MB09-C3]
MAIVLEFRRYKRLDDKELIETTLDIISEIKQMPYEYDDYRYMSQIAILNNLIKEIKLRDLTVEKNTMIKNILLDFK